MKIIINETGATKTLSIIDPKTECDYISDFIGNTGDLTGYDEDQDAYLWDQDKYDWWGKVVTAHQALDYRIADLSQEHGSEAVYRIICAAGSDDLEMYIAAANTSLDEVFGANMAA